MFNCFTQPGTRNLSDRYHETLLVVLKQSFGLGSFINLAQDGADPHFSADCKHQSGFQSGLETVLLVTVST